MSTPVLATKLFAPARRPQLVARPRLTGQLDTTLDAGNRLTLLAGMETTPLLDRLAHDFKCGTLVVLQALRRTGVRQFRNFDGAYDAEVRRLQAVQRDRPGAGGGDHYNNQPFRIGERLSRALVADALEGRTSLTEAMDLMSMKTMNTFDEYARRLHAAAGRIRDPVQARPSGLPTQPDRSCRRREIHDPTALRHVHLSCCSQPGGSIRARHPSSVFVAAGRVRRRVKEAGTCHLGGTDRLARAALRQDVEHLRLDDPVELA